ncbi:MAG TPA: hypothetical protein PLV61_04830 [Parvularculaceae bacterium]|nr:hypothetical protein [Parvularculaceae bacterium]
MCDTLALKREGAVWFAKNSDREPEEPQRVEFHQSVAGDKNARLRCTYIEIDQVPDRHAVVISRPDWMWGAEMGVNSAGVAIGNEDLFSKKTLRRGEALLGMDLLRLGLERGASADEVAGVIIGLLKRYGQGGPAGYANKSFRYDNSFLIADGREIIVLETAGRDWALKRAASKWAISNTYSLHTDYDRASASFGGKDFKAENETWLRPRLACASLRAAANEEGMEATKDAPMSLGALAQLLRGHASGDGFSKGSNRDVCMHSKGPLRPSQTTGAMIAKLVSGAPPRVAFTGTSSPCVSLFKPAGFSSEAFLAMDGGVWEKGNALLSRAARDKTLRAALRRSIGDAEPEILKRIEAGEIVDAETLARRWGAHWLEADATSALTAR